MYRPTEKKTAHRLFAKDKKWTNQNNRQKKKKPEDISGPQSLTASGGTTQRTKGTTGKEGKKSGASLPRGGLTRRHKELWFGGIARRRRHFASPATPTP